MLLQLRSTQLVLIALVVLRHALGCGSAPLRGALLKDPSAAAAGEQEGQPRARIYSSRDYGIHFMEFEGNSMVPKKTQRLPLTVWMWLKCFKTTTTVSSPDPDGGSTSHVSSTLLVQGFYQAFYKPNPYMTSEHHIILSEKGMWGWAPDMYMTISNSTETHGWSPTRHKFRVLAPRGVPGGQRKWKHPGFVPSAIYANITIPNIDLRDEDLPMQIQVLDWSGINLFSTGFCEDYDHSAPRDMEPQVVVTRKPAYNVPLRHWLPWISAHVAYHTCMGFSKYLMHAYSDQVHILARDPELAAMSAAGALVIMEWPRMQYLKHLPEHGVNAPGEILGMAHDNLIHTHGLLAMWHPIRRAFVVGVDLDEFLGSSVFPRVSWSRLFKRHPQGVVTVLSSPFACTKTNDFGVPYLRSCIMKPSSKVEKHMKSFLDTWRVQTTDEMHTGVGFNFSRRSYGVVDSDQEAIHLFHLRNILAGDRGGKYNLVQDNWLQAVNVDCLASWAPRACAGG